MCTTRGPASEAWPRGPGRVMADRITVMLSPASLQAPRTALTLSNFSEKCTDADNVVNVVNVATTAAGLAKDGLLVSG